MMKILYEDQEMIVCHKEGGIPVQSARIGQKDMVSILNNYLSEQAEKTGVGDRKRKPEMIRVVHRLDQPVEGVMVFAKTAKAAAALSRQITEGRMEKIYRAVCCVTKQGEHFCGLSTKRERYELCDMLLKNGKTNTSSVVKAGTKDAKEARLSFVVLEVNSEHSCGDAEHENMPDQRTDGFGHMAAAGQDSAVFSRMCGRECLALVEIALDTGRHHQIRVQMAHAGLPLCGDRKYNKEITDLREHDELALCAVRLSFEHPVTGKRMCFSIEPEKKLFRGLLSTENMQMYREHEE